MRVTWMVLSVVLSAAWARADTYAFTSRHYRFETDADREVAGRIADHMDLVFDEYARRFSGFAVRNAGPLQVWVFQTREDYLVHLARNGLNGLGTGGMFFITPEDSGLASWIGQRPIDDVLATMRHEGLHQFAYQRLSDDLPQWVNEGMAEYFGHSLETKRGLLPGVVDPRALNRLRSAIEQNKAFGLDELLFIDNATWNTMVTQGDERAALLYDQSWSVVHFLVNAEGGRYERLLAAYLKAAWQGKHVDQASREVFGPELETMERAWRQYVEALEPDPLIEATDRLEVFAQALLPLFERGDTPKSVDELRALARERQFKGTVATSAGPRAVAPDDGWWLDAPTSLLGNRGRFRLTPDRTGRTPPAVEVRGLRRAVRLVWHADLDGAITHRVEIE